HPLLREGPAAIINNQPDMQIVAEAATGCQALQLFRQHQPDITLMDLRLPDMSGIEALFAIRTEFPEARIIVLTTFDGDADIRRSLEAGARAYLLKNMPPKELVEVIRQVQAGKKRIPAEVAAQLTDYFGDQALSEREVAVLRLLTSGNRYRDIA